MKLLTFPNDILLQKTKLVTDFDEKLHSLAFEMIDIMRENVGIGIAANQVGLDISLAIIEYEDIIYELVNPCIIKFSKNKILMKEGCLSLPEIVAEVERFEKITLRAQNLEGKEYFLEADGLLGQAIQHEISHLNGELFINLLSPLKRKFLIKEYLKKASNF